MCCIYIIYSSVGFFETFTVWTNYDTLCGITSKYNLQVTVIRALCIISRFLAMRERLLMQVNLYWRSKTTAACGASEAINNQNCNRSESQYIMVRIVSCLVVLCFCRAAVLACIVYIMVKRYITHLNVVRT